MVNEGSSIDMTRAEAPYSFIKDPDAQEFALSDYYSSHGQGAGEVHTYHSSMSDVNDDDETYRDFSGWIIDRNYISLPLDVYHEDFAAEHLFDFEKCNKLIQSEKLTDLYIQGTLDTGDYAEYIKHIPDEIGLKCCDPILWEDLKEDPVVAFSKFKGAIRVSFTNFWVYSLTQRQLNDIRKFIKETSRYNKSGFIIEQMAPYKSQYHNMKDFLLSVFKPADAFKPSDYQQDVNDLSLQEVWEGAKDLSQSAYQGAKDLGTSVLQNVGIIDKPTIPSTPTSIEKQEIKIDQPQITTPQEKSISALQTYLKSPTPAAQVFLNGQKYSGNIDGRLGPQTKSIISTIENNLNKLFNTRKFSGTLLLTTPDDIETALQKALKFKSMKQASLSKDERIYKLGKFLIEKQRI